MQTSHTSSTTVEGGRRRIGTRRARWAAAGLAVGLVTGGLSIVSAAGEPSSMVPITPCRVADTRSGIGPQNGALGAGATLTIPITGNQGQCTGIPADATGVALNITATDPTAESYLTVWPTGVQQPNASSLNYTAGAGATPNAVLSELGAGGRIDVYNYTGEVNVIVDVTGYFVAGGGAGVPGPQGAAGPQGPAAWDLIPAGETVVGIARWDLTAAAADENFIFSVSLPGRASAPLASSMVNFKAGDFDVADGDAACTGTTDAPTAPAGKVCLYMSHRNNADDGTGTVPLHQADRGFLVKWDSFGAGDTMMEVVWAYTQPG